MRADRFKPGGLAWTSVHVDSWYRCDGLRQTVKGYPVRVKLEPGKPCTVIRRALAKDYGVYARHVHNGKSSARRLAERSWLVLYDGIPTMIDEEWLKKRHYTPRKPRGKCVTAGTDGV